MKRFSCIVVLVLCACTALAQVARDIPFVSASDDAYRVERCKLDVYAPEGAKDLPVVVWFHGGGLTSGDKTSLPRDLKESGFVVVSAGYRLIPKGTIADCFDDAAAAVAWAFENVSRYGGSPEKIFLSGHSAGATLIDMVGLDKRWLAKYGVDIPYSEQEMKKCATPAVVKNAQCGRKNQPASFYLDRAKELEEQSMKTYKDTIDIEDVTYFTDLQSLLWQNYYDRGDNIGKLQTARIAFDAQCDLVMN